MNLGKETKKTCLENGQKIVVWERFQGKPVGFGRKGTVVTSRSGILIKLEDGTEIDVMR